MIDVFSISFRFSPILARSNIQAGADIVVFADFGLILLIAIISAHSLKRQTKIFVS